MAYFNGRAMDPDRYITYYQNQAGGGTLPGYAGGHAMYTAKN